MDTTEKPVTYIIVYNGGAYGNFVGWVIHWLTGKIPVTDRPWGRNGNSHNNNIIKYYRTVEDACKFKETGVVHPILDDKTLLKDILDNLQKNFDKVIFLYPNLEDFIWNINNKFEKIFEQGWINENFNNIEENLTFWKKDIENLQNWEIREWLSYYIFPQHLSEVRFNEFNSINNTILKISLSELRDETFLVFKKICNFLDLKIVRSDKEADLMISEWKELQIHKHKDRLINDLTNAIVENKNIKFSTNLTIVDQAEIQRRLREKHNIEIKCYGLNDWPTNTSELNKLLIRKNTNETTL